MEMTMRVTITVTVIVIVSAIIASLCNNYPEILWEQCLSHGRKGEVTHDIPISRGGVKEKYQLVVTFIYSSIATENVRYY